MPLKALLANKEFFAWNLNASDRKKDFICPVCKTKFIVVLPKQETRIKYFRHFIGKAHQENETEEHVKGKLKIIETASKLGLKWDLERQIGRHVTDVYIEGEQPLAVEFQCSKCNSAEIADRTQTYAEQGVAVFWILGSKFNKDFNKKTRTKIEREIEKVHPTVYYAESKYFTCRNNPARCPPSYGYSKEYFASTLEKLRLVEDFDIEWHLTNLVKTKLTPENPNLIFKWMVPEKPEQEKPPLIYKKITPCETPPPKKVYPVKSVVRPSLDNSPVWIVKKIASSRKCERCEKHSIEYIATLQIRPNKVLDKTRTQRQVCSICLGDLKHSFPNAIWKFEQEDQSKT